jgi:hypothetical protein
MSFFKNITIFGRNIGKTAQVSPMRALSTFDQVRLCGTPFHGTTKDTSFWSETGTTANGSVTQAGGQVVLTTTVDSGSAAIYTSTRTGRYVSGSSNKFRAVVRFPDLGTVGNNNIREFGAFTATDGFLFQLNANVFNIVVRKASTADQVIAKASWTGTYAAAFTLDTNVHTFEIQWTNSSAWFFIDDNIMHTVKGDTSPSTATLTFPVAARNINTLIGAAVSLNVRTMSILRMGQALSMPMSYYHASGTTAGVNLKVGAGNLHRIVFGGAANNAVITLADSITGATPSIWVYTATGALAAPASVDLGGLPFLTGLRLIVATGNASCTIIYE